MERLDSFLEERDAIKDVMRSNDSSATDGRLDKGLVNVEFEPGH